MLQFFRTIGVPIREAWGMTEVAGVGTMQASAASPVGSVGQAIAGVEVRLGADNEVLVRGPTVFKGYYKTKPRPARRSRKAGCTQAMSGRGWTRTANAS